MVFFPPGSSVLSRLSSKWRLNWHPLCDMCSDMSGRWGGGGIWIAGSHQHSRHKKPCECVTALSQMNSTGFTTNTVCTLEYATSCLLVYGCTLFYVKIGEVVALTKWDFQVYNVVTTSNWACMLLLYGMSSTWNNSNSRWLDCLPFVSTARLVFVSLGCDHWQQKEWTLASRWSHAGCHLAETHLFRGCIDADAGTYLDLISEK